MYTHVDIVVLGSKNLAAAMTMAVFEEVFSPTPTTRTGFFAYQCFTLYTKPHSRTTRRDALEH